MGASFFLESGSPAIKLKFCQHNIERVSPERLSLQTYFYHPSGKRNMDFEDDKHTNFFILEMDQDPVLELTEGVELVNMGTVK
jgi:hypothetical protein